MQSVKKSVFCLFCLLYFCLFSLKDESTLTPASRSLSRAFALPGTSVPSPVELYQRKSSRWYPQVCILRCFRFRVVKTHLLSTSTPVMSHRSPLTGSPPSLAILSLHKRTHSDGSHLYLIASLVITNAAFRLENLGVLSASAAFHSPVAVGSEKK